MIEQGFPEVYLEHTLGFSFMKNTISKWRYKTCFNLASLSLMFVYSNNCGKQGTVHVREMMMINIRWEKHTNITFRYSVNRLSSILFETPLQIKLQIVSKQCLNQRYINIMLNWKKMRSIHLNKHKYNICVPYLWTLW